MTIKGKIVTQALKDFPNAKSLTLAKKLYEENKEVFKDTEDVRGIIRYYRGANGDAARKILSTKEFVNYNPLNLPPSDEAEYLPYYIRKESKNILCLYDIHVPYHNVEALTAAIQYGKEQKVDSIYIGGDFLDFHGLSNFVKDPRKRSFREELETGKEVLRILREHFPKAYIYYQLGNHEERYERYMQIKAPELLDIQQFQMDALLEMGRFGIELIDEKRIIKAGKLNLVHGHEFGRQMFSPVNPARGLYLRAKESTMCGHHHQTSEHTEPTINGTLVTCWSVGCLCELHPNYRPINKWNHGFAHIQLSESGFKVKNIRIKDGEIL